MSKNRPCNSPQNSISITRWLLLAVLLLFAGCSIRNQPVSPNDRRQVTDEFGRSIQITASPQRIISLAPNLTETLFALGLGDRVVGVTSYCDFPEAAKSKERVGDTINPNLERIIALKPDLVVVTTSSQLQNLTDKFGELSIPVYVTNPRGVREVIASIKHLGEATGASVRANEIAGELERRVAAVEQRVRNLPQQRVLYVLQNNPLITAGRNTFINDLINLAGGRSISGEEQTDYPQFSREAVIARAPEIIVVPSSHGSDFVKQADLLNDFADTPAVKLNRIVRVDADLVDRPGPRIVDGLEQLSQGLHPESP